ncbi:hypothetical protein PSYMP_28518, partial [Pseudomonas amygdali pv. morsprunorum str. M302280]
WLVSLCTESAFLDLPEHLSIQSSSSTHPMMRTHHSAFKSLYIQRLVARHRVTEPLPQILVRMPQGCQDLCGLNQIRRSFCLRQVDGADWRLVMRSHSLTDAASLEWLAIPAK